ncbi:hypothetical protein BJ741DRAFT_631312 [Chytriomyces cf. hyalinus JEL632]|nr:hypothetical protein BJ741DRAFT_631312 [Chytriomyces cf. hyalinus JEL632]
MDVHSDDGPDNLSTTHTHLHAQAQQHLNVIRSKTVQKIPGIALIFNNMTGIGMIQTPLIFQQSGWLPVTLFFILFMIISSLCALFIVEAMQAIPGNRFFSGTVEFGTLIHFYFGTWAHISGQVMMYGALQSLAVASMIQSSQTFDNLFVDVFRGTCGVSLGSVAGISASNISYWSGGVGGGVELVNTSIQSGVAWICVNDHGSGISPFGDTYMLFTAGYLTVVSLVVPMCYFPLTEFVWVQTVTFSLTIVIFIEWISVAIMEGFNSHNVPMVGDASGYAGLVGVVMLNFAFVQTIPSWVNVRRPDVSIQGSIWTATSAGLATFLLTGLLPALAYTIPDNSNLISVMTITGGTVSKVFGYLFSIAVLMTSIPVLLFIVQSNLEQNFKMSRVKSIGLSYVFPWLCTIPFQTGNFLLSINVWSGLILVAGANFIVPLLIYLKALHFRKRYNERRYLTKKQRDLLKIIHSNGGHHATVPRFTEPSPFVIGNSSSDTVVTCDPGEQAKDATAAHDLHVETLQQIPMLVLHAAAEDDVTNGKLHGLKIQSVSTDDENASVQARLDAGLTVLGGAMHASPVHSPLPSIHPSPAISNGLMGDPPTPTQPDSALSAVGLADSFGFLTVPGTLPGTQSNFRRGSLGGTSGESASYASVSSRSPSPLTESGSAKQDGSEAHADMNSFKISNGVHVPRSLESVTADRTSLWVNSANGNMNFGSVVDFLQSPQPKKKVSLLVPGEDTPSFNGSLFAPNADATSRSDPIEARSGTAESSIRVENGHASSGNRSVRTGVSGSVASLSAKMSLPDELQDLDEELESYLLEDVPDPDLEDDEEDVSDDDESDFGRGISHSSGVSRNNSRYDRNRSHSRERGSNMSMDRMGSVGGWLQTINGSRADTLEQRRRRPKLASAFGSTPEVFGSSRGKSIWQSLKNLAKGNPAPSNDATEMLPIQIQQASLQRGILKSDRHRSLQERISAAKGRTFNEHGLYGLGILKSDSEPVGADGVDSSAVNVSSGTIVNVSDPTDQDIAVEATHTPQQDAASKSFKDKNLLQTQVCESPVSDCSTGGLNTPKYIFDPQASRLGVVFSSATESAKVDSLELSETLDRHVPGATPPTEMSIDPYVNHPSDTTRQIWRHGHYQPDRPYEIVMDEGLFVTLTRATGTPVSARSQLAEIPATPHPIHEHLFSAFLETGGTVVSPPTRQIWPQIHDRPDRPFEIVMDEGLLVTLTRATGTPVSTYSQLAEIPATPRPIHEHLFPDCQELDEPSLLPPALLDPHALTSSLHDGPLLIPNGAHSQILQYTPALVATSAHGSFPPRDSTSSSAVTPLDRNERTASKSRQQEGPNSASTRSNSVLVVDDPQLGANDSQFVTQIEGSEPGKSQTSTSSSRSQSKDSRRAEMPSWWRPRPAAQSSATKRRDNSLGSDDERSVLRASQRYMTMTSVAAADLHEKAMLLHMASLARNKAAQSNRNGRLVMGNEMEVMEDANRQQAHRRSKVRPMKAFRSIPKRFPLKPRTLAITCLIITCLTAVTNLVYTIYPKG